MPSKGKHWIIVACCTICFVLIFSSIQRQTNDLHAQAGTGVRELCTAQLSNGGFETDAAWSLPVTPYSADYSTEQVHSGERSMRAGIVKATDNVLSYSSAVQTVQIPTNTQTVTLSFWWYPVSTEGNGAQAASVVDEATLQAVADGVVPAAPPVGDQQYMLLLNPQNRVLARLLWTRSNAQSWQQSSFDLTAYAGQTVRVLFGVYNDGANGVTALFVDDATLESCAPLPATGYLPIVLNAATSTPTLVPTAPPTAEPTPTASVTPVWTDPTQAIEVFSPVAAGLYHSPIVVNGFSRTFEGNVNLRLTDKDGQVLAERNTLGGSVDGFDFFDSYLRFTVSEPISATLDVFETSAMDGSEINKVQIPVVLWPGQRVIDLNTPIMGAQVCNPVLVSGYSNTFEATLAVTLNGRDGTQLTLTPTMGGNLGIYADFSTTISHTVSAPQPLLVGAFEESAAGFGPVDQTRIPVELHPTGSDVCP